MLQKYRNDFEGKIGALFEKVKEIAFKIDLELTLPRRMTRQRYRENYPTNNVQDYFRQYTFYILNQLLCL